MKKYTVAALVFLASCGVNQAPNNQPLPNPSDFKVLTGDVFSDTQTDIDFLTLQGNTASIGTGPFSKTALASSQVFNWVKMELKLPKVNPESLLKDGKRFCEIKAINSDVRKITLPKTVNDPIPNTFSVEFSRQNPQLYTGFNGLDIGIVYNTAVYDRNNDNTACARTPYVKNSKSEINKWTIFSNNSDGNRGIAEFSSQENDLISLEFWLQKVKFPQPTGDKTVFAIKITRGSDVALQARVFNGNYKVSEAIKRVFSLAQTAGFQRLYGDPSLQIQLTSVQIGVLKSSYGVKQWNLLIQNLGSSSGNNFGTGNTPIPTGSLPVLGTDIDQLTDVQTSVSKNFSEDAGVTKTSPDSRNISITLLKESAIDGLISPFKLISELQPNGNYPTLIYKVANSGRAPLKFKIPEPKWLESDPSQEGTITPNGETQVKFKIKVGNSNDACPKAPFKVTRPFFRFFRLQDTKVLSTATNDPTMIKNQIVSPEPKDAVFDGSSLDRTATFHTLATCATAELDPASFMLDPITLKLSVDKGQKDLTFKNSGGPTQGELKDIPKYEGSDEKAFTAAELKQIAEITNLEYELTVKAIGNVGKSNIIATIKNPVTGVEGTTGKLPVRQTATIKIKSTCQTAGTHKFELTLNAKNDPDVKTRMRVIPITLVCPPQATVQTAPTPITLTGNVGSSTNTIPLTISNTGDQDSTLEYKQYFTSQNLIDSSLLNNPTGTAGARLTLQAVNVPPTLESSLTRANGFSPSSISTGELKVLSANTPVSSPEIPVSYYCSSAGTFNGYVNVVYSTGATNDAGVAILESQAVNVTATCTQPITPKLIAGTPTAPTSAPAVLVGHSTSSTIKITNVGDDGSLLSGRVGTPSDARATAIGGFSNLAKNSSADIKVIFACDAAGTFAVTVPIIWDTLSMPATQMLNVSVSFTCTA